MRDPSSGLLEVFWKALQQKRTRPKGLFCGRYKSQAWNLLSNAALEICWDEHAGSCDCLTLSWGGFTAPSVRLGFDLKACPVEVSRFGEHRPNHEWGLYIHGQQHVMILAGR